MKKISLEDPAKTERVNFKCSKKDLEILKKNADEWAFGNLSAWILRAAKAYKPGSVK
jgi:hypothetical protein